MALPLPNSTSWPVLYGQQIQGRHVIYDGEREETQQQLKAKSIRQFSHYQAELFVLRFGSQLSLLPVINVP